MLGYSGGPLAAHGPNNMCTHTYAAHNSKGQEHDRIGLHSQQLNGGGKPLLCGTLNTHVHVHLKPHLACRIAVQGRSWTIR